MKKKEEQIHIKLSAEEKKNAANFCKKNHISISELVRELLKQIGSEEMAVITHKEREILYQNHHELQKIGVNLNQIAHFFNLEHLKNLNKKNRVPEDLLLIDKLHSEQIKEIKAILSKLDKKVDKAQQFLEEIYG